MVQSEGECEVVLIALVSLLYRGPIILIIAVLIAACLYGFVLEVLVAVFTKSFVAGLRFKGCYANGEFKNFRCQGFNY